MLEPESFYGNVEYKRCILSSNEDRLYQLATQMLFRLNEGNGNCYYYLGIEDNGNISNISKEQLELSLENLKKIVNSINCCINNIKEIDNYLKIEIKKKKDKYNFEEIKVLLVGDTMKGKTTFLAFLVKNLLCKNANLFLLNHKHELETGKNSSISIYYKYINNIYNYRLVFFDTPGSKKYKKTTNRLINKIKFDVIMDFNKNIQIILKDYILNKIIIDNNIFNINEKNKLFDYILDIYNQNKKITNIQNNIQSKIKFIIIKKFYNVDTGTILFGYLEQGYIYKNQKLLYKYNDYNIPLIVLSIFIDNIETNFIDKNYCFTIRVNEYIKSKNGIITNNI